MRLLWLLFSLVTLIFPVIGVVSSAINIDLPESHIQIPMPSGKISQNSVYGPVNYNVQDGELRFLDPALGLIHKRYDRLTSKDPPDILFNLGSSLHKLPGLLRKASLTDASIGEIIVASGERSDGCDIDVRLVVLVDGDFTELAQQLEAYTPDNDLYLNFDGSISEVDSKNIRVACPCNDYGLQGKYGTDLCPNIHVREDEKETSVTDTRLDHQYSRVTSRTIYIVSGGLTVSDWSKQAYCSQDAPLSLEGIQQAHQIAQKLPSTVDTIISAPTDASVLTAAIISKTLDKSFTLNENLRNAPSCDRRYASWRLMKYYQSEGSELNMYFEAHSSQDLQRRALNVIERLPEESKVVILIVPEDMAVHLLAAMDKRDDSRSGHDGVCLSQIHIQNSTGIPHFQILRDMEYLSISSEHSTQTSEANECETQDDSRVILDLDLLRGVTIDYTIPKSEIWKKTPSERAQYIRFSYERRTWLQLYYDLDIFEDGLMTEQQGIRYWGRFPVYQVQPKDDQKTRLIGESMVEFINRVWS